MAYHQPAHDPYHHPQTQQHNTGIVPDLPPTQHVSPGGIYQQHQPAAQGYYQEYDDWDGKSHKSYQSAFADSQVHLNAQYEMSQVHTAVPTMPYQQYPQQNYPPVQQQRPMMREQSSGYSDARQKMMNRRSVMQVELQQGNLVLDMQVPSHIIPATMRDSEETTKLRYTAATCDPDDFMRSKFSLRPYLYGRQTELFIVMTMYNEDEVLFCRTMNG